MRQIVSNTGPVLHLSEIGALELLRHAGDVCIPRMVDAELTRFMPHWGFSRPAWVFLRELEPEYASEAAAWQQGEIMHVGEAAALALARQIKADWFLTDDAVARVLAQSLGLEVHGTLGIALWAAATDLVDRTRALDLLNRLAQSSMWISPRVLTEAKAALDSIFA